MPLTSEGEIIERNIQKQTLQGLKNVEVILKEAGSDLNHVIETTVFLKY